MEFDQGDPKENDKPASWNLVVQDMKSRDDFGRKKYGTPLQPLNGRDSLQDAYEEVLDLCVYLRNAIEEKKLLHGRATAVVNEYLHSPELVGKNLAQSVVIDVRELLKAEGL